MSAKTIVELRKAGVSRSMGPHVRQVIPSAVHDLDPFVFLDHFGPFETQNGAHAVPAHPHAGIATITYLYSGVNRHQDSQGHDATFTVGDLAWMNAGRGIVHAEGLGSGAEGAVETIHGLQLWISLPAKDKFSDPTFDFFASKELPEIALEGGTLKVLCGSVFGKTAPMQPKSPAYLFDVQLDAGATARIPIQRGDTSGLYVVSGDITTNGRTADAMTIIKFDEQNEEVVFTANTAARVMLLGGTPLREPIVAYGSFVMNSEAQIRKVIADYHIGNMGDL